LGGRRIIKGKRIALDARGNDYLTGYTQSTDFPVTGNAYQTSSNGNAKVFLSILTTSVRTPPARSTDSRLRGRTR
ncbi:MAG: SBBP repeat-containing protein, partial [Chloroflexi bacterium]|nr:SBBP repeat-containing protein [Chloroflexota bacterium]